MTLSPSPISTPRPGRRARVAALMSPSALMALARTEAGRRAIRYVATSAIGVVTTQVTLAILQFVVELKPLQANFTAVTIVSIPMFMLNKYWVWGKRGRAHMRREVIPFWMFTVAGWILSTLAVAWVVNVTKDPTVPDLEHGNRLAVQAASLSGFGVLWVLKYLFLDKIMFGPDHHTPYDEDIELEDALDPSLASDDPRLGR